jgi:hypothetical protein
MGRCRFSGRPRSPFGIEWKSTCALSRHVEILEAHSTASFTLLALPRNERIRIVLLVFWKRRAMGQNNQGHFAQRTIGLLGYDSGAHPLQRGEAMLIYSLLRDRTLGR